MPWYGWILLVLIAIGICVKVGWTLWTQIRAMFSAFTAFTASFSRLETAPIEAAPKPATMLDDALLAAQLGEYRDRRTRRHTRRRLRWQSRWGRWWQDGDISH